MAVPQPIQTWLSERLGLRYPIVQAPMAGGPTTPTLVAAVGKAGALGSFGFAYTDPPAMTAQVAAARALASAPLHVNLFVDEIPDAPTAAETQAALAALMPLHQALGVPPPVGVDAPYAPDLDAQVRAAIGLRPALLSTHFRQLSAAHIAAAHAEGIVLAASATTPAEAQHIAAIGVDVVIAQGAEAGGHRGIFSGSADDAMIGTLALVRLIARNCPIPVIAAGGIMDGAGLAAVMALGACGAQMGTAFLATPESGAPETHKSALFDRADAGTAITRAFSGRPARGIRNAFMQRAQSERFPILPFPIQNKATAPLRAAAAKQGKADYVSLWAGQAYPLARRMPAGELVELLAHEYHQAVDTLAAAGRG